MNIPKELIEQINILARKKREQELTESEQKQQKKLYAEYLGYIQKQVVNQLEFIKQNTAKPSPNHSHGYSCSCCNYKSNSKNKK
ncbi:DUF896 domain-containing protein [Peptococcaceae bacterium]|nr:DUF896 domain-containing protein [Peptococcaceae bacterium]